MYIVYNVYMKYYLADFRKNTREAFNLAEQGKEVLIFRHGVPYRLKKAQEMPTDEEYVKAWNDNAKTKLNVPQIKTPRESLKPEPLESNIKFCKHDNVIGFCKKGCK